MSGNQIVIDTITFYAYHFLRLVVLAAIIVFPLTILTWVIMDVIPDQTFNEFITANFGQGMSEWIMEIWHFICKISSLVIWNLFAAVVAAGIVERTHFKEFHLTQGFRKMWPKLGSLIIASVLIVTVMLLGMLLSAIPFFLFSLLLFYFTDATVVPPVPGLLLLLLPIVLLILFLIWFSMTIPAIVVEDLGPVEGMKRSRRLAKGNCLKIFWVLILMITITIPAGYIWREIGTYITPAAGQGKLLSSLAARVPLMLVGLFVYPFSQIAFVLLYRELSKRKKDSSSTLPTEGATPS